MKFRITPGDWRAVNNGPHWNNPIITNWTIEYSEDGECIVDHVYSEHDAHAIEAVPKMLALLVKCRDWCDHYSYGAHRLLCHEIDSLLKELGGEE